MHQKDFYQLKELEKLGPKLKGIGMSHDLSAWIVSRFSWSNFITSSLSVSEGSTTVPCG